MKPVYKSEKQNRYIASQCKFYLFFFALYYLQIPEKFSKTIFFKVMKINNRYKKNMDIKLLYSDTRITSPRITEHIG